MVDLRTTYMGIEVKNPLILASGLTTDSPEICAKAAKDGWAGVVLKSNAADDLNKFLPLLKIPRPRYKLLDHRGIGEWRPKPPRKSASRDPKTGVLGKIPTDFLVTVNLLRTSNPERTHAAIGNFFNGVEPYLKYIAETKRLSKGTDCKVIASIIAQTEEGFEQQCEMINRSDADMLEINFGCPTFGVLEETGETVSYGPMGTNPEIVERWCRFVTERIKGMPVGAKLPGIAPDPLACARAAVRGGAQGIVTSMAVEKHKIAPISIDPDTLKVGHFDGVPYVTYPMVSDLSITLGNVANYVMNNVGTTISASGGVREPMDVIRLIMAGATTIQTQKLTMVRGVRIAEEFLDKITKWMEKMGYQNLSEIQGVIANEEKLTPDPSKFSPVGIPQAAGGPVPPVMVTLDKKRCIQCRWCEECCPRIAITQDAEEYPDIDQILCEICGMCPAICPMDALSIQDRV